MRDAEMEELEAELRRSQFSMWDVETLLIDRHKAKIEALSGAEGKWPVVRQTAKELTFGLLAYVGFLATATMAGYWMLTGNFLPRDEGCVIITPVPPAIVERN